MPHEYTITAMTLDEYQAEAARTMKPGQVLAYYPVKLVEEAVEAAQPINKHVYHDAPLSLAKVNEELGDLLWYIAATAEALGLSLEAIAASNIRKLRARHGTAYNAAHYTNPQAPPAA